jgi:butyrate kinase
MTQNTFKILVINPGSTSDEISYYDGEREMLHETVRYTPKDLEPFESESVTAQFEFRSRFVFKTLEKAALKTVLLDAVIGRGGLLHPIPSGTYVVNEAILEDLRQGVYGDHPSNLGGIIAHAIAGELGIPAFIADPVVVDEMEPVSRFSGMPDNPRISIFHALNQKRVARLAARELGKPYEDCSLIVMHGGGGITVGAHKGGRVVDVNNGLDGDGPFTPQRSGGVPAGGLVRLVTSRQYSTIEMKLKIKGRGGLVAYLGTSDLLLIEKYIAAQGAELTPEEASYFRHNVTPAYAELCLKAMAYQISKEICSLLATFEGAVDAIVLTGGIVRDQRLLAWIKEQVGWAAPVLVYPGGDEMGALRDAAVRVLRGEEKPKLYEQ